MDCKQTSNLLNAYVDKELSKSDQTYLEAHLAECPNCRAELEDITRLDAQVREELHAPEHLRSVIASRIEASRTVSPRVSLKEMLGMRYRMGFAAIVAAALIVVGVMSTGGNAQAAYMKMKKAVTTVTSMHLHLEFSGESVDTNMSRDDDKDTDNDKDNTKDAFVAKAFDSMFTGGGPKSVDVWSKDNMFRVSAFGGENGINVAAKDGWMTVMIGGSVLAKVKADDKDIPKNLGDTLFKEFSKMSDEMKEHFNVVNRGTVQENGRTLSTLEVTGKDDNNKDFRLMYWVDQSTNLPARFQVWGSDGKSEQKLICTISCEYNESYPDSMFEVNGKETP